MDALGFAAFMDAARVWLNSTHGSAPPSSLVPSEFGLDSTSLVISSFLSLGGSILIFLGAAFLVIFLVAKIFNRISKLPGLKARLLVRGFSEEGSSFSP